MSNLSHKFSISALTRKIAALETRIEKLEAANRPPSDENFVTPQAQAGDVHNLPRNRRFGPRPRLSDAAYLQRWNVLFFYLTCNWPELRLIFMGARDEIDLGQRLTAKRSSALQIGGLGFGLQSENALVHLVEHRSNLWHFLQSRRYARQMRNVAHAMAGVPILHWRTSIDIGHRLEKKHMLTEGFGERGMLDHFRLRHRRLFALMQKQSFDEAASLLSQAGCAACRFYAKQPAILEHFWREGQIERPRPS